MSLVHKNESTKPIAIELSECSFFYKNAGCASIKNVSLKVPQGQCIVITGQSGCGKTTLTRMVNGLIPLMYEGTTEGSTCILGKPILQWSIDELSSHVGSVFQNPRSQLVNLDVTSEIAFGCENIGLKREIILERVAQSASALNISNLLEKGTESLSGGEKQSVILASIYAVCPEIFVLDEPTASLDVSSMRNLAKTVSQLKSMGKTILISEHRLWWLEGIADRYVVLENGEVKVDYSAEDFLSLPINNRVEWGLRAATLEEIESFKTRSLQDVSPGNDFSECREGLSECKFDVIDPGERESKKSKLDNNSLNRSIQAKSIFYYGCHAQNRQNESKQFESTLENSSVKPKLDETFSNREQGERYPKEDTPIVQAKGLVAGYRKQSRVLNNLDFFLSNGRVVGIIGRNGAGKTTLMRCLAGLLKEKEGTVELENVPVRATKRAGRVFLVMQEPGYQLFSNSVDGELADACSAYHKFKSKNCDSVIEETKRTLALEKFSERHPLSLSGGERQRLSIAAGILSQADAMILDEPTSGLDYRNMQRIMTCIERLKKRGVGVCIVSHDYEFLCSTCDLIALLEDGRIADSFPLNEDTLPKLKRNFGFLN